MRLMYAIMRDRDGRFLPCPPSGQKGGSWVEPADPAEHLPRMFKRERDAKAFLTVWLRGPIVLSWSTDWETGIEDVVGQDHKPEKAKEPRIASEWRVVPIEWRVAC